MPDVFNEQYATQQRLQESKRAADEARLRNKKKADETVMGYAFVEVCVQPIHAFIFLQSDEFSLV
jgi:hypothetical protein